MHKIAFNTINPMSNIKIIDVLKRKVSAPVLFSSIHYLLTISNKIEHPILSNDFTGTVTDKS